MSRRISLRTAAQERERRQWVTARVLEARAEHMRGSPTWPIPEQRKAIYSAMVLADELEHAGAATWQVDSESNPIFVVMYAQEPDGAK